MVLRIINTVLLLLAVVASVFLLGLFHVEGDSEWIERYLSSAASVDETLWQVHTTFLSVGFAGLAIAAQLFAQAPLAIGASRGRVLGYIHAGRFVGVGLAGNAVIAIETIWLQSDTGVVVIGLLWFMPTVILLVLSTVRLTQLFGHPSRLDEVVRVFLVGALADRLTKSVPAYANAKAQLEGLVASGWSMGATSSFTLRVPVSEVDRLVKSVRPKVVREAIDTLGVRATVGSTNRTEQIDVYEPVQVILDVEPGDRTRLGETAFRVITPRELDEATTARVVRLLQSSIAFEPPGAVTPYEETDREIANLKDAVGVNVRSGALSTAERALELLGYVVRGVWLVQLEDSESSRRASFTRNDWLFRSLGEVEQDALLSPRVAGMFVGAAMTRALEAPRTGSAEYVNECLRSFSRLWFDLLRFGGPGFESTTSRILTCVQNLTMYSWASPEERESLQPSGVWTLVELVKLGVDAEKPEAAKMAARELNGLFEFDRFGPGRSQVRAGQLVLAGWLDYLAYGEDETVIVDPNLRALVTPRGTWSEILTARAEAERGAAPNSRWDLWEMNASASSRAQVLRLPSYIDRAQLSALSSSHGPLPPAKDQESASEYKRFLGLLKDGDRELTAKEEILMHGLAKEVENWKSAEYARLAEEPLSETRLDSLRDALSRTLNERTRLVSEIPSVTERFPPVESPGPILGINFLVSKDYFVDKIFNQTYADPADLGQMIAQAITAGEERMTVAELRSLQNDVLEPRASVILRCIQDLGDEVRHFVLVTPYGGMEEFDRWYSTEFKAALESVTHIETRVLDNEAFLFDRRTTLTFRQAPADKEGLMHVEGTSLALGVFEDVQEPDEPTVRIETGQHFSVGRGDDPRLYRFGGESQ